LVETSRRELAKENRRQRILNAAEVLIEESGSTDFTMKELGERAGISRFTTYNLIGQKATVLYLLLNRSLDDIDARAQVESPRSDPAEFLFQAAEIIVKVFTSRPKLYRPLFRYLLGSLDRVYRPDFMRRSSDYWRFAFTPLEDAGYLGGAIRKIDLVREAQMFFTGVLEYWANEDISHRQFSEHVRQGFSIKLLVLDIPGKRDSLLKNIEAARPGIINLIGE